ncbi:hypothetical protein ACFO8O_15055 [Hephaestia sp. GCM10023244]|uniref:hypothetical protein n=1 Tax=unclassified Hephaestia TaxID=2631281 RepID=UPI002076EA17|nr:hypothetical protein [Hephaestia sp. MAHUQ-44]MCM8732280.1 hypothetical protein [Hephaestia sp. MAHUQ-44]
MATEGTPMTGSNERVAPTSGNRVYRVGVAVAVVTSFLTVRTTIIRDDGAGIGFFLLIMAAMVGAFSAWFQPAGMARTMVGVAIMQVLLGVAIATAPSTALVADGPSRALLFSGVFAVLWLISAACFGLSAKADRVPVAAA